MQTTPHTKGLRKAMGALSLGFLIAAGNVPANANQPAPPPGTTTSSVMFTDIEQQANAYLGTTRNSLPRIAIIDFDQINTTIGGNTVSSKLHIYLQQRGLNIVPKNRLPEGTPLEDESEIFTGMGRKAGPRDNAPRRVVITSNATNPKPDACIVVPELTDLSSRSLLENLVGAAGPLKMLAAIDPGPYQMTLRSTWHEVWHCLDREFVQAKDRIPKDSGFEIALGNHRAEMFADVAATLTMASHGDLKIMQQTADFRAIHSRWKGPAMMVAYSPETDSEYYDGVAYYTTPAHDAALAHINQVGLETVKRYTLTDIQRIATDLTHQNALNEEQFHAMTDYLKQGDNYLRIQNQKAASGDTTAKRNIAFLTEYKNRTAAAKSRIMTETTTPVIPKDPDYLAPDMEDILLNTPERERAEIYATIKTSVTTALRNGQTARQGVFNQLEIWRKELQTSPGRRPDLEQKLYLAAIMLSNGHMDPLLKPAATKATPKPSP